MNTTVNYKIEERLNTFSHAIGVVFGVLGFFFLLTKNAYKTPYATISIVIYSVTFISMFVSSTLYHYVSFPKWKNRFRILDHINIYFLIAGTYTPLLLISLESGNGWPILYTVWGIAAIGTILKLFYTGKYEFISLLLYLAMGWLIIFDYENLVAQTTSTGIHLLFLGGAFYSLGILFYAIERIPYNHFVWHIFVLGGAISHWFLIYYEII